MSSTLAENAATTNPLAVGDGSCGGGTSTTAAGGYLVMASPSTSPPSHHESEALARLKRANLTLRERKNEERTRSGATSGDLPAFAPAHLHLSPRRPSSAAAADTTVDLCTRPRASSTEKKDKKEKEKSTRKWKKKSGTEHKKAPVEEWKPKEVAKWLQAIELGDYAKAARKKKIDGAQLVKVVDTILATSPSADHADGGFVLAALGVKKLGHLKRLQRELRQVMLDSNGGGDDDRENEDGDGDDGVEESEEERERRKHRAAVAGKLPIPRGNSAPIAVTASLPVASSPNRLRRLVHNLSGSSTTSSSLSSSPSATSSSSSSPSSSAPSSVSFPAIDSDSDSFLSVPTSTSSSTSSPSLPADCGAAHGRPRTRSKLIERLATGMPRSRSAESPLPLTSTSTLSPSLGRSGSGFGGNGGNGGGGSCPLPAVVVSPPLSPSGKRPGYSANFIAVAHGTASTLFDAGGDDDCSGSTISTISTSSSSSSSSSSGTNTGAIFSFSFHSTTPTYPPSSSSSHSASSISATWDASSSSCTSLAFCSMFGEIAIKCVVDDDISLVRLNLETDLSLSGLQRAIERVYGQRMHAHYFDSEGDKIRITTDSSLRYAYEDWCQALERSGATISWRLHLKPRSKARAHSDPDASSGPSTSPSMSMDVVADYVADEAAAM